MLRILQITAAALVLCWLPLFVVGTLDPTSNPVGLGLLATLGSVFVMACAGVAVFGKSIATLWRHFADT